MNRRKHWWFCLRRPERGSGALRRRAALVGGRARHRLFCPRAVAGLRSRLRQSGHRGLEALLHDQLQSHHLGSSRLVLAGFGLGARLALQLWLDRAWSCAGILAIGTHSTCSSRASEVDCKVRLIDCAGPAHANPGGLQTMIARFDARGIDARGVTCGIAAVRRGHSYGHIVSGRIRRHCTARQSVARREDQGPCLTASCLYLR